MIGVGDWSGLSWRASSLILSEQTGLVTELIRYFVSSYLLSPRNVIEQIQLKIVSIPHTTCLKFLLVNLTLFLLLQQNIVIKAKEMDLIMDEIYAHFDENQNRLIEQDELKLILQVPANFLDHIELYKNLNKQEFSEIFEHYDRDSEF